MLMQKFPPTLPDEPNLPYDTIQIAKNPHIASRLTETVKGQSTSIVQGQNIRSYPERLGGPGWGAAWGIPDPAPGGSCTTIC